MKSKMASVLVFCCALAPFAKADTEIGCRVKHTLIHGNFSAKARYSFHLDNTLGVIMFSGKIVDGEREFVASRNVHFTFTEKKGQYRAVSKAITKIPTDNVPDGVLEKHYPAFFAESDKLLTFDIHRVNDHAFMISFVNTPTFYCYE